MLQISLLLRLKDPFEETLILEPFPSMKPSSAFFPNPPLGVQFGPPSP